MSRPIPLLTAAALVVALLTAAPGASAAPAGGAPAIGRAPTAGVRPGAECANDAHCRAIGRTATPLPSERSAQRNAAAARAEAPPAAPPDATVCDDGSGAFCGTVAVPLDYRRPSGPQLHIAWKLYRHTTDAAAISTTAFLEGGPGVASVLDGDQDAHDILGDSFAAHDVLLVDARGRGASGALDCEALQHGVGALADAVRACGKQLGDTVNAYNAASAARDLERVRASLAIAKLDLVGLSYGSMESIAYATRFPSHVRSIVLASGATPEFTDFTSEVTKSSTSGRRVQTDLCHRSAHCDEIGAPLVQLALAAAALRKHPLTGSAPDPLGDVQAVTVTQNTLVRAARLDSPTLAAWVLPAAVAYLHGDPAPLLRLGAAKDWEAQPSDSGDPAEFSKGLNAAEYCSDKTNRPWPNGLTETQRAASALRLVAALPQAPFLPWSGTAMVKDPATSTIGTLDYCISWPDTPRAEPVLPAHAVYPDVPVLAVVGSYDSLVDETVTIADAKRFPRHQVVTLPAGGHLDAFFNCPDTSRVFLDTLGRAPACDLGWHWFIQPSYPTSTARVPTTGIVRQAGDASTAADRRTAAAAWRTVLDAWIQTFDRPDFTTSKGLRGGTLRDSDDGTSEYDIDLAGYRFVGDLALDGRLVSPFSDAPTSGTFHVSGAGGTGRLTVTAHLGLDRDGLVTITGTLGGHAISVTTSSF